MCCGSACVKGDDCNAGCLSIKEGSVKSLCIKRLGYDRAETLSDALLDVLVLFYYVILRVECNDLNVRILLNSIYFCQLIKLVGDSKSTHGNETDLYGLAAVDVLTRSA